MTEATPSMPGTLAAPIQTTAPTPAPALSSATATTQQTVTIPLEQVQAFTSMQARLAQLESEQRSREQTAQQEQARILAQKGEVENALRMLRDQSEQQVQSPNGRGSRRSRSGPSGMPWTASSLAHWPRATWSPAARSSSPSSGGTSSWSSRRAIVLRGADADVPVGRRVRLPAACPARVRPFRPGSEPGRAVPAGVQPSAQTPPSTPANLAQMPQPKNMGEAVILHMQGMQKAQGDPRANMTLPMGLKAAR